MSSADSQYHEEEFIEAQKNWELEKLYTDLASAKRKALTPVEKKLLRGLLCGCSPAEIAKRVYHSRNSSTVRVYLSNGLYKYIEDMLSNQLGYSVKLKNWSHVTHLLEKAGYKKSFASVPQVNLLSQHSPYKTQVNEKLQNELAKIQDWGEAVDVSGFCGRGKELNTVSEWILQQHCRLVVVLGMGGIGKTAFSVRLAQEIQEQFECVIWRSLHLCPKIDALLTDLLQTLTPGIQIDPTVALNTRVSQLIDSLRRVRCLLVLDSIDSVLCNDHSHPINISQAAQLAEIQYLPGYEGYSELIKRIGNCQHQSCLLITSREKPPGIGEIEGEKLPVRSFKLTGLSNRDSLEILHHKGLTADETECDLLIEAYAGHPLFLKLVANTIYQLLSGNIYLFLARNMLIFGEIRKILDEQFNRLSELEKYIMYWLVLNPDCTSILSLINTIMLTWSPQLGQRLIWENLELLQRRSLIDIQAGDLSLSLVWKNYLTERLREKDFPSLTETDSNLLISDPTLAAHLQNYIQEFHQNTQI